MNVEQIFQQVMSEDCPDPLHRFAELVRQDEREACAKLCDEAFVYFDGDTVSLAYYCSKAIRARGDKHDPAC